MPRRKAGDGQTSDKPSGKQPTTERQTHRQDRHLVIYFAWPVLLAFAISTIVALSRFGLIALKDDPYGGRGKVFARIGTAARLSARTFFVLMPIQTIVYPILVGVAWWVGPILLERIRHPVPKGATEKKDRPKPRDVLPVTTHREPPKTIQEKFADARDDVVQQITSWRQPQPEPRQSAPVYASQVSPVDIERLPGPEPDAGVDLLEYLVDVTYNMRDLPLTRRSFQAQYEGGAAMYTEFCGKQDPQCADDKGIWGKLGWIQPKESDSRTWEFKYDFWALCQMDRGFQRMAARLELIRLLPPPH